MLEIAQSTSSNWNSIPQLTDWLISTYLFPFNCDERRMCFMFYDVITTNLVSQFHFDECFLCFQVHERCSFDWELIHVEGENCTFIALYEEAPQEAFLLWEIID